jgi:hypothetical protein
LDVSSNLELRPELEESVRDGHSQRGDLLRIGNELEGPLSHRHTFARPSPEELTHEVHCLEGDPGGRGIADEDMYRPSDRVRSIRLLSLQLFAVLANI